MPAVPLPFCIAVQAALAGVDVHVRDLGRATDSDTTVIYRLTAFLKDLATFIGLPEEDDIRMSLALAAALLCTDYMPKQPSQRRPINVVKASEGLMDLMKQHGSELHR